MSHTHQDLDRAYSQITPLLVGTSVLITAFLVIFLSPPEVETLSCESKVLALSEHQRYLIDAQDAQAWCDEHPVRYSEVLSWASTLPTTAPYSTTDGENK